MEGGWKARRVEVIEEVEAQAHDDQVLARHHYHALPQQPIAIERPRRRTCPAPQQVSTLQAVYLAKF